MKIKKDYIYKNIAGQNIVVPVGKAGINCNEIMTLSGTGTFIFKILIDGATKEEIITALINDYNVEKARAEEDVTAFLDKLQKLNILED